MDYFLGEIRLFPYAAIPKGCKWVPCDGQLMPIMQNQALYSLLGVKFGGDGKTNFNLPNLNGRTVLGQGQVSDNLIYSVGNKGGAEAVALAIGNIPIHNHGLIAINNYETSVLNSSFLGNPNIPNVVPAKQNLGNVNIYAPQNTNISVLNTQSIENTGIGLPHENRMPYLTLMYCICIGDAIYPTRQ